MVTITIPKTLREVGDLVLISKKELDALIVRANDSAGQASVLRWSKEAKAMRRSGKLPILRSLGSL